MTISPARRLRLAAALPLLVLAGMAVGPVPATAAAATTSHVERAEASHVLAAGTVVNPKDYPVSSSATGRRHQPPFRSRTPKAAGSSATPGVASGSSSSNATLVAHFTGASMDSDISCCGGSAQSVEPPDTVVAAGTSDIVEAVNGVMRVTDKSGAMLGQTNLNTFFQFPNANYSFTDPRVAWDAAAGRWFLTGFGFDNLNDSDMKIATSTSSDPTSTWVLTDIVRKTNVIADQPKTGFDSNLVVMSWDDYDGSTSAWQGSETWVLEKSDLVNRVTVHTASFPATQSEFSVVPAQSYDGGTTAYAAENDSGCQDNNSVGTCSTGANDFQLISFTGLPSALNVTRSVRLMPMSATTSPTDADQPGALQSIDTNDDRFLSDTLKGNVMYVTGNDSCKPSGDTSSRPCIRFLEVNLAGTPSLSVNTDIGFSGQDVYFGAAVPDSVGDVAIAATQSSTTVLPSSVVLSAVAGSTTFTSLAVTSGTVLYDSGSTCLTAASPQNRCRWGDYAGAAIDPSNPNALWLASEWGGTGTDFSWSTTVSEVDFPATKLAISAPASTIANERFNFSVTAQLANGATASTYTGTVHFTSSDPSAVLPVDYTFVPADQGTHTFSASLVTSGSQTLTATDTGTSITGSATINVGPQPLALSSARQYQLTGSDGSTWQPMDLTNLRTTFTPSSMQTAVITANSDLWTAVAGYNQDIGISVSPMCVGATSNVIAWKESGGFAGTFSPNAAAVQGTCVMNASTAYTMEVVWKANVANGAGGRATPSNIFAGAGGTGAFSPTTLNAYFYPGTTASHSNNVLFTATSAAQYALTNASPGGGTDWAGVDVPNLSFTFTPSVSGTAYLSANADLWTSVGGINQNIGINVAPPCNNATLTPQVSAWKESGGNAGTFSPNAAFVQDACTVSASTTYTVTLDWRSNRPIPNGQSIEMGAGQSGAYSPTTLFAQLVPNAHSNSQQEQVITSQKSLQATNVDDGTAWRTVDNTLNLTVVPGSTCTAWFTANADLWTATAGYNQDLGIDVTPNGGSTTLLAWHESGGYAGTFSPNAAFVQGTVVLPAGTYTVNVVWRANRPMPIGASIWVAAGSNPDFSPTSLLAQLSC